MTKLPIVRLLPLLLLLLLPACFAPQPGEAVDPSLQFLRALGDVAVRIDGTAALQKYAPEAIPILDVAPTDGTVSLAEIERVVASSQDPESLVWLLLMVRHMVEARRG